MTLLIFFAVLAIGVSFLCSLLEASLLSIPAAHVQLLCEKNSASGRLLRQMKENIDRPLSAILTLNTIAHTIGAAGVGWQVAVELGDHLVGLASAIMTLLILVLSEIIPKTLGAVHAKRLAPVTAWTTRAMMFGCWPILIALEWMNRLIGSRRTQTSLSRSELLATLQLGERGGVLSRRESAILRNVLALQEVTLRQVLTPRTVVFALPQEMTVEQATEEHGPLRFSRIPIHAGSLDEVTGYVTRYDLQRAPGDRTLRELVRPLSAIPEQATVAEALDLALPRGEQIMTVVNEYGGTEGVVTLEDLVETMLGMEIVDETDAAVDMQKVALRLAERRQRHDVSPES